MNVLIADDHPVVRQGLKQILAADAEIKVVGEARNAAETLKLARKLDWHVALIDYSMPGPSGLELLKELKREFPQRPVLILSMYPEELHATRVLKSGAAGYLNKECVGEELTAAVHKALNGGRYVSRSLAEKLARDIATDTQKPPHETLADREYRVMWLLASGKRVRQIAAELFLSPSTVSTYRMRIFHKLGSRTNADLVHYVIKHGLVD